MIFALIGFYFGFNVATTLAMNYGDPESTKIDWLVDLLFGLPLMIHALISSKL
jgi:hypothetical protein